MTTCNLLPKIWIVFIDVPLFRYTLYISSPGFWLAICMQSHVFCTSILIKSKTEWTDAHSNLSVAKIQMPVKRTCMRLHSHSDGTRLHLCHAVRCGLADMPVDISDMWHQPTFPSLSIPLLPSAHPSYNNCKSILGIFWWGARCAELGDRRVKGG